VNKDKIIALVAIVVALFIISGSVGYLYIYPAFFTSPKEIITEMLNNLIDTQMFHYNARLAFDMNDKLTSAESADFEINGDVNISDPQNPLATLSFDIKNIKSNDKSFGSLYSDLAKLKGDLKLIGKNIFYIKISGLKNALQSSDYQPVEVFDIDPYIKAFDNRWIETDLNTIKIYLFRNLASYQKSNFDLVRGLSEKERREIKKLNKQINILKLSQELPNETLGGDETYHYKVRIDKENASEYLKKLYTITTPSANGSSLSQKEMDTMINSNSIYFEDFDVWINKKNRTLKRLLYILDLATLSKGKASGNISIDITYDNINKPNFIEAPAEAVSLNMIINNILSGNMTPDSDSDKDGLYDLLEIIYGTDPNNLDTDGDGYSDGVEINNGYNPLGAGKLSDN